MLCLNTQKESGRQICPDSLSFTKMGSDNWTQETVADQPSVTVLIATENIKCLMVELHSWWSFSVFSPCSLGNVPSRHHMHHCQLYFFKSGFYQFDPFLTL